MSKGKKRGQPSDPATIARINAEKRRNPALWGLNTDALKLASNDSVQTEAATREKVARAQRYDVFHLFHARRCISTASFDAVRRLETDIATRTRTEGSDRSAVVVDSGGSTEMVTARSLDAAGRVEAAYAEIGTRHAKLLKALCEPTTDSQRINWRNVVFATLGDHRKAQQADYVILACEALEKHYRAVDNAPRRVAA